MCSPKDHALCLGNKSFVKRRNYLLQNLRAPNHISDVAIQDWVAHDPLRVVDYSSFCHPLQVCLDDAIGKTGDVELDSCCV